MMRRLGTDHEVDGPLGRVVENIACPVLDGTTGRGRGSGNRLAHGIEVDADQIDGAALAAAPGLNLAQEIAIAVAYIENRHALVRCQAARSPVEPSQNRTMGEGQSIDRGEILEAGPVVLEADSFGV